MAHLVTMGGNPVPELRVTIGSEITQLNDHLSELERRLIPLLDSQLESGSDSAKPLNEPTLMELVQKANRRLVSLFDRLQV